MPFPIVPAIMAGTQLLGMLGQNIANRRIAKKQHGYNLELMHYQNAYNSPVAQMERFKDAGLNPNLIYGQGNSGNMSQAPSYPDVQVPNIQALGMLPMQVQQMRLMESQADLTRNRANESGVKQDLMRAQESLVRANPLMNADYVDSLVRNLMSTANIKEQESKWRLDFLQDYQKVLPNGDVVKFDKYEKGLELMDRQLELLNQKYRLGEIDAKIKAEIVESKEFANDLSEIQRNWMKSGDITPQHIYTFVMLLMSKLMSK